ncbi:MAG: hypothetical protein ACO1NV_07495 [Leptospira bouyouniensis]|uniref:Uncharacterized protein n=1 Tax=Leptospira bouyouniensis TaxID=2484911 RepID=A0A7I0HLR2_9LEPT|nr:hypothetical protein [Leptospira bouyouniensis]TGK51192.1 hypothetical protein EHQ10_06125 [Leptospira bouyouniensis]TGL01138.1 hypothetical protein EHQ43_18805 [Leptospira bouyouniensis]TGM79433.1 hypothetical protein EHQ99_06650 [Leptospira bouyouniensis]
MTIRLENSTGRRSGRFVAYEYGEDLFGTLYLNKFSGREKGRLIDKWRLSDLGSLIRVLDTEISRREEENYERPLFH